MKTKFDLRVYVLTDAQLSRGRSHLDVIAAAIRGGATMVQYREKSASTRVMIEEARQLQDLCRAHDVPFIVNDRVDVALAVDADGVHVGQDDMPAALARKIIGADKILGVSAETPAQALQAIADGADYLGVGTVFVTGTKPDAGKPIGLEGVGAIARLSKIPIVGIGGINLSNAGDVIGAGAQGVSVISAIVSAVDVQASTRELRAIVDAGLSHPAAAARK